MSDNTQIKNGGNWFCTTLFLVFLTLKLGVGNTSVMAWSWLWVCAPLWIPLMIGLPLLIIVMAVIALKDVYFSSRKEERRVKKFEKSSAKFHADIAKLHTKANKILNTNFTVNLDIDDEKSYQKSIRRHEKKVSKVRFSIKRWWKEGCKGDTLFQKMVSWYRNGNKKVAGKKALKSENKS